MKKTFQSFVFGCRVNEAERMRIDKQLVEAGFSIDLASPSFLVINTCAITGKAEREAKQLVYQLQKKHPQAQIVLTGCSATLWKTSQSTSSFRPSGATFEVAKPGLTRQDTSKIMIVPNDQKSRLVSLLLTASVNKAIVGEATEARPWTTASVDWPQNDKFRHSNRLLVKIQEGCNRFCSYCIVPYLRGRPQSERIKDIVSYINFFIPTPSEVVLSAINTEAFGMDTGESLVSLIQAVLQKTSVPRIAFGSIHPWSLTDEFIEYYKNSLSKEPRFMQFFHVPIQSGSQTMLKSMKREYVARDVIKKLSRISKINPNVLIATDVIVGFLGETDALFEETYALLEKSPISRFHVFRFSNRPHTAAFYMKKNSDYRLDSRLRGNDGKRVIFEPTAEEKKKRSDRLMQLSRKKYLAFIESQEGRQCQALVIAKHSRGTKILLDNHIEGILLSKHCLPGSLVRVTIMSAKDGVLFCKES